MSWFVAEGVAYNLAAALWARRTGDTLVIQFPGHTLTVPDPGGELSAKVGFPPPRPAATPAAAPDRGKGGRR